jgi:hypothetical protein
MTTISTRDLSALPDVDRLKAILQAMAMLDAILSPEWQYRYYSFNSRWAPGERMGSMRDGCGDDLFALFNAAGCFLKGFAHEAPMTPYRTRRHKVRAGVLDEVPPEFADCLSEPAFCMSDTTFCIWRRFGDPAWQRGKIRFPQGADPDGSALLLSPLDGEPRTYKKWADDYYETDTDLAAVGHVYGHLPLTREVVRVLNPEVTLDDLAADVEEIGYPRRAGRKKKP